MANIKKLWNALPRSVRQLIVLVIGSTLILIGLALIVLPGPFTMPLVILGLFVLAIEFAWAESLLTRAKNHAKKLDPRKMKKNKPEEK
jgi:Flp pilus assembly protein TadB